MRVFEDDDDGYIAWLAANLDGFVVNTTRPPAPSYMKVHRATRFTIGGTPAFGRHWTRDYLKACACTIDELHRWASTWRGEIDPCPHCLTGVLP